MFAPALLLIAVAPPAKAPALSPAEQLTRAIAANKAISAKRATASSDDVAKVLEHSRAVVDKLLKADALKTGREFELASEAYADSFMFEPLQRVYELQLTAALLGDRDARVKLPQAWDRLVVSIGLGQRFGTAMHYSFETGGQEPYPMSSVPSSDVVAKAWKSLADLKPGATENEEVKRLAEEDQKDRTNFDRNTPGKMFLNDRKRRQRLAEIFQAGALTTAEDFSNAGLIQQHGEVPADYELAHECAVVAAVLKAPFGQSLCSVSYDRFLLSTGHRQRFGTQLGTMQRWWDRSNISPTQKRVLMAFE